VTDFLSKINDAAIIKRMTGAMGFNLYDYCMRHGWVGMFMALLIAGSASAADNRPPLGLSVHRLVLHDLLADHVNYLLYVPASYSLDSESNFPLIIFLHGSDQRGDNPALLNDAALLAFAEKQRDFPFIAVLPQCPQNTHWPPMIVKMVLDSVEAILRIDRYRVYLTGFSMGGYGTWQTAAAFPGTFAAIAPVCGLSDLPAIPRLLGIPIWAFHGAKDLKVPVAESQRMIAALCRSGADARLTVYPDLSHDCWTMTYRDSRLYLWFLDHSLSEQSRTAVSRLSTRALFNTSWCAFVESSPEAFSTEAQADPQKIENSALFLAALDAVGPSSFDWEALLRGQGVDQSPIHREVLIGQEPLLLCLLPNSAKELPHNLCVQKLLAASAERELAPYLLTHRKPYEPPEKKVVV
jgi:pimeloyl-ACP methyl ester carboxylesterase